MFDLFEDCPKPDIEWKSPWLEASLATLMMENLVREVPWKQDHMTFGAKSVALPRLTCWQGEPEAEYVYSGIRNVPVPWTQTVREIREQLREDFGLEFNSVLLNRYRTADDSMGWHSDDEPELGDEPVIASVSLGATRTFEFRHKKLGQVHALPLKHGSLLVMQGQTQKLWTHRVPRETGTVGERINLTFRLTHPR